MSSIEAIQKSMRTFFLIVGTVAYTLLGVLTYQTFQKRYVCLGAGSAISVSHGIIWPVTVVVAGSLAILGDDPDIWRCQRT